MKGEFIMLDHSKIIQNTVSRAECLKRLRKINNTLFTLSRTVCSLATKQEIENLKNERLSLMLLLFGGDADYGREDNE